MKIFYVVSTMPTVLFLQHTDMETDKVKSPVDNSYFITLI